MGEKNRSVVQKDHLSRRKRSSCLGTLSCRRRYLCIYCTQDTNHLYVHPPGSSSSSVLPHTPAYSSCMSLAIYYVCCAGRVVVWLVHDSSEQQQQLVCCVTRKLNTHSNTHGSFPECSRSSFFVCAFTTGCNSARRSQLGSTVEPRGRDRAPGRKAIPLPQAPVKSFFMCNYIARAPGGRRKRLGFRLVAIPGAALSALRPKRQSSNQRTGMHLL